MSATRTGYLARSHGHAERAHGRAGMRRIAGREGGAAAVAAGRLAAAYPSPHPTVIGDLLSSLTIPAERPCARRSTQHSLERVCDWALARVGDNAFIEDAAARW